MKKIVGLVMVICLCAGLVGCGGDQVSKEDYDALKAELEAAKAPTPEPAADADFITDIKKALQIRWDISDTKTSAEMLTMDSIDAVKHFTECVNAELDILKDYPNKVFTDVKLKKLATDYVQSLNSQTEALKYYSDVVTYNEKWNAAYDSRTKILLSLVNDYGLTVDEKYQDILLELTNNAQVVTQKEEAEASIAEIEKQVDFKLVENEDMGSWKEYETILENTTDVTFEYYQLEISLLDADGVIIGQAYGNSINNWAPGAKAKIKFSTDEQFDSLQWKATYYVK